MTFASLSTAPWVILGDPTAEKMEMPVIKRWFADKGDQTLRLDYPLTKESIVLDLGGYEGNWAAQIHERYGCRIHIFEPVEKFAANIEVRFSNCPNVTVHRCGLAARNETTTIRIDNDSSSVHKDKGTPCKIFLRRAADVLDELHLANIDLVKINIEGCEYDLLDHLVECGAITRFKDIQVQFHDFVPDAPRRMAAVQSSLARTHELCWQYRFVWENWRRH